MAEGERRFISGPFDAGHDCPSSPVRLSGQARATTPIYAYYAPSADEDEIVNAAFVEEATALESAGGNPVS